MTKIFLVLIFLGHLHRHTQCYARLVHYGLPVVAFAQFANLLGKTKKNSVTYLAVIFAIFGFMQSVKVSLLMRNLH